MAGQIIVPVVCVLGALVSTARRRKRKTLADTVSQSTAADALDSMSWREFELLMVKGFGGVATWSKKPAVVLPTPGLTWC